ncbi:MAG: ABC transporter substrate-binding protein [Pyrinomonadaceae bacterium]
MRFAFHLTVTALLSSSILIVLSCGERPVTNASVEVKTPEVAIGVRGGEITYRLTGAPTTFNYLLAEDEPTIIIALYLLTSRLVEFDHKTQQFVPGLAESWSSEKDNKTVNLKLREGLKFSDGHALTSSDVIFTLGAIYDERTQAAGLRDAMLVDDERITAKKIDDRNLQLIFPKAVASFENYLINLGVMPEHALKADFEAGKLASSWKINAPPESVVSSGPFVVARTSVGQRFEFARNPHYYKADDKGTQLPYLDKLNIEVIEDVNKTFVDLSRGAVDLTDKIRPTDFAELTKNGGAIVAKDAGPGLGVDHIWFNLNTADNDGKPLKNQVKRAWFADKRFRRAIAAAVDRDSIATNTLQGLATPLHGFVSPANKMWAKPDLAKINYDLAAAEKLLTEAGFHKRGTPESPILYDAQDNQVHFSLVVPAGNEPRTMMAIVLEQDLAKLGIKMSVVLREMPALMDKWTKTYDYDAILLGIAQGDTEPSSYQNFLPSSGALHQWQPDQKTPATEWEAKIDNLFDEMTTTRDVKTRYELFANIQDIVRDQLPVIPVVARHVPSAANSKIGNWSPSSILPYSIWNVEQLYIKP